MEKKRIYSLPFRTSTTKDKHYFGVHCEACGKPILRLNPTTPDAQFPLKIDGKLAIPCHSCEHDGLYESSELGVFQADEDYVSVEDARIKPSGSPRKPFLQKKATRRRPTMGIGSVERRPVAAQLIARCITHWTSVETGSALLLAKMMRADSKPAIALYLSLKNARAKSEALDAVAATELEPRDRELFQALLAYKDEIEGQRNDIAHGVFGVSESFKDGVLWMTTTDYATYQARVGLDGVTDELVEWMRQRLYVYEPADLETVARAIENVATQIGYFSGYLGSTSASWRASRYHELCREPGIREALLRVRNRKNKK